MFLSHSLQLALFALKNGNLPVIKYPTKSLDLPRKNCKEIALKQILCFQGDIFLLRK